MQINGICSGNDAECCDDLECSNGKCDLPEVRKFIKKYFLSVPIQL